MKKHKLVDYKINHIYKRLLVFSFMRNIESWIGIKCEPKEGFLVRTSLRRCMMSKKQGCYDVQDCLEGP